MLRGMNVIAPMLIIYTLLYCKLQYGGAALHVFWLLLEHHLFAGNCLHIFCCFSCSMLIVFMVYTVTYATFESRMNSGTAVFGFFMLMNF